MPDLNAICVLPPSWDDIWINEYRRIRKYEEKQTALKEVEFISSRAKSLEAGHPDEDDLWEDVLCMIANGFTAPIEAAKAALETRYDRHDR